MTIEEEPRKRQLSLNSNESGNEDDVKRSLLEDDDVDCDDCF